MTATDYNQKNIDEFHSKNGRGVGPWGDNLLLMTSKGRATGTDITTPLVYRRRSDELVVVASKGGSPENPTWLANIIANPSVVVEVAGVDAVERFQARARVIASGDERDQLYAFMTEVWPGFADYAAKTERTIPVVVLERTGQTGTKPEQ